MKQILKPDGVALLGLVVGAVVIPWLRARTVSDRG
jgi:hypothetical protein